MNPIDMNKQQYDEKKTKEIDPSCMNMSYEVDSKIMLDERE